MESLEGKTVLVTGASGHTGRRLVRHLSRTGVYVRALMRDPTILTAELRRRITIVRAGFEDTETIKAAATGVDAVVAMTHIKFAPTVLKFMREARVSRCVFVSSTRRFTKFPEETAHQVLAGEEAIRSSGMDYTILRPSMIYGGREDNNLEHLLTALRRWPIHPLVGGGDMLWQPVFTWDVVHAILAALERPETIGKEYTLAGPVPITYRQMVETILREAKLKRALLPIPWQVASTAVTFYSRVSPRPRIRPDQIQRLKEDKVFDISEAQKDLGFGPISFEEGIRQKLAGKA